jgi:hypothetical protein
LGQWFTPHISHSIGPGGHPRQTKLVARFAAAVIAIERQLIRTGVLILRIGKLKITRKECTVILKRNLPHDQVHQRFVEGVQFQGIAPDNQLRTMWFTPLAGGVWRYCVNRVWYEWDASVIPEPLQERLRAFLKRKGLDPAQIL